MMLLVMIMVIIVPVNADNSQFMCVNDSDLNEYAEFTINGNQFTINETVTCPHGCSDDFARCKPSSMTSSLFVFLLSFILLALMYWLSGRIDNNGEIDPVALTKMGLIPIALITLGFFDIFQDWQRTLFGILALGTIILISLQLRVITKSPKNIKDDQIRLHYE